MFASIKETALAKVGGTVFEKALYYLVVGVAVVLFLLSLVTVGITATEPVTEIKSSYVKQVPFPAVALCLDKNNPGDKIKFMDAFGDGSTTTPRAYVMDKDNFKLLKTLTPDLDAPLTNMLEAKSKESSCLVINSRGREMSEPGKIIMFTVKLMADAKWSEHRSNAMVVLDPNLTLDEQKINFFPHPFNIANSQVTLSFTVEKHVDKTGGGGLTGLIPVGTKSKTINKFTSTVSSTPYFPFTGNSVTQDLDGTVLVRCSSYMVTTITKRMKTFTEIWTQVGAAWSSALLIVTIFFIKKSVPAGDTNENVQVFRLRTVSNKKELASELQNMVTGAKGYASDAQSKASAAGQNMQGGV